MRRSGMVALMMLAALATGWPAAAWSGDDNYSIMVPEKGAKPDRPEPWLAPTYKSPRGTRQHVVIPRPPRAPHVRAAAPPPPIIAPSGQALPNLPTVSPSGPRGTETFQDRAVRCAHQAGVYGNAAGNAPAYLGSCVNQ